MKASAKVPEPAEGSSASNASSSSWNHEVMTGSSSSNEKITSNSSSSRNDAQGESPYAMQAKGFAEWLQATDAFGFSAFPAGRNDGGRFNEIGFGAHFWTSTEDNDDRANHWALHENHVRLLSNYDNKYSAFSVRCVKD